MLLCLCVRVSVGLHVKTCVQQVREPLPGQRYLQYCQQQRGDLVPVAALDSVLRVGLSVPVAARDQRRSVSSLFDFRCRIDCDELSAGKDYKSLLCFKW